jgi:hypothetical protein
VLSQGITYKVLYIEKAKTTRGKRLPLYIAPGPLFRGVAVPLYNLKERYLGVQCWPKVVFVEDPSSTAGWAPLFLTYFKGVLKTFDTKT